MQSVLSEFIADGLNEGGVGGGWWQKHDAMMKVRRWRSRWQEVVLLTAVLVMFRLYDMPINMKAFLVNGQ